MTNDDKLFKQYAARIEYLLSEGYPESEALRLVRDDAPIPDAVWKTLVNAYEGLTLPERSEVEERFRVLRERFGELIGELEQEKLNAATDAAFYQAVEDYYRLAGERKLWDELTEQQREQARELFDEDWDLTEEQYSYELDPDGNVITRWPRPSLSS